VYVIVTQLGHARRHVECLLAAGVAERLRHRRLSLTGGGSRQRKCADLLAWLTLVWLPSA
jgi:hypothetical protein